MTIIFIAEQMFLLTFIEGLFFFFFNFLLINFNINDVLHFHFKHLSDLF